MYLINSMQVSGIWQSDSVIHIRVSILFQVLFSFRLLQNIGQGSCAIPIRIGPYWLPVSKTAVCISHSQPPSLSLPTTLPPC